MTGNALRQEVQDRKHKERKFKIISFIFFALNAINVHFFYVYDIVSKTHVVSD